MSCDCHVIWGQSLLAVFSFSCEREGQLGWEEGNHRHQCGSVEGEGEREHIYMYMYIYMKKGLINIFREPAATRD